MRAFLSSLLQFEELSSIVRLRRKRLNVIIPVARVRSYSAIARSSLSLSMIAADAWRRLTHINWSGLPWNEGAGRSALSISGSSDPCPLGVGTVVGDRPVVTNSNWACRDGDWGTLDVAMASDASG